MRTFVRTFKMQVYEILAVSEFLYSRLSLAVKIGVQRSRGAFHIYGVQACTYGYTLDQIDS